MDFGARPSILIASALALVAFLVLFDREGAETVSAVAPPKTVLVKPSAKSAARGVASLSAPSTDSTALPPLPAVRAHAPASERADIKGLGHLATTSPNRLNGHLVTRLAAEAVNAVDYRPSMGAVLAKHNGFILVAPMDAANPLIVHAPRRPVFLNPLNGRIEIVSGTLIVKLKTLDASAAVAGRHRLTLLAQNESILRAYYRMPDGFSLVADLERLGADPDVDGVEVEITRGKVETR